MLKKLFLFPVILLLISATALAAANRFIPFQARLTDGDGIVLNGVYKLIFIIYDEPTGGTAKWTEEHQDVSIINGMVNVILGTKTNLDDPEGNGNKPPVYFTDDRYLGITVGTSSNQEMVPRHQIVPSFQAKIADRAFSADRALEADNADRLNNQLPAFYATKTSVDDVSSDLNQKITDANSLVFTNATAIRNAVPAGTIMAYIGETLPTGYLLADGSSVAVADYPELYAAIGTMFGSSVDHFNLPDLRGQFLRGWANGQDTDPDRDARADRGDGTTGDAVGTTQADIFAAHKHIQNYATGNYHTGRYGITNTGLNGKTGEYYGATTDNYGGNTSTEGGNETRPKNIAVMYIIKY